MMKRLNIHRVLHKLAFGCFCFIGATTLLVLVLRFCPPLTSGIMIERRIESLISPTAYTRYYHWQPIKHIAEDMRKAVIAAEDQRFAEHNGFDWQAIEAAYAYNEKQKKNRKAKVRGASTISQQTAKNLFLWSGRSWVRKGLEAYFTFLIELLWPKERILEIYLNIVEFGDGIYGVDAAAEQFFGKSSARLTASESALLAAVLPNPRVYQVENPGKYIRGRKTWILRNMKQTSLKALGQP